ncbi:MAG: TrkH family potassium uptake protein [bacterium]
MFFQKVPFLIELLFNGAYILLYSLYDNNKLPSNWDPVVVYRVMDTMVWFVPLILLFIMVVNYLSVKGFEEFIRKYVFSLVIFIPMIVTWGDMEFSFWLASVHLLSSLLALYDMGTIGKKKELSSNYYLTLIDRLKLQPAQFVLISFAIVIFFGAFLLKLPVASATGQSISLIDAIFMATSATCVTGLSTISVIDNFSLFGQIVILVLIQVGGLGIMTLQSSMTILLGRSMGVKDRLVMQDLLDISSMEDLVNMVFDILKYTLIIELWGGILLTIGFTFEGFEFGKALYLGFFHSISAFCNAGFSLFNNSLESFSTNSLIHGTVAFLIILGGLGFIVLRELKWAMINRKGPSHFSLHAKIVLLFTIILLVAGTLIIFLGEYLNGLDNYTLWGKLQVAFFQSATLRTAGFNTIPLTNFHTHTIYLMSLFMFVGACPGSTAGGIKVSTFAILIQSIRATLKGSNKVEFFDRAIPNYMVVRATALTIISIMAVSFFVFLMMKIEPEQNYLPIFFEVVSAFGTVGLSLGLTSYLSAAGKLVIVFIMFMGRVGPMTMVLAIGQRQPLGAKLDYPEGRIIIG